MTNEKRSLIERFEYTFNVLGGDYEHAVKVFPFIISDVRELFEEVKSMHKENAELRKQLEFSDKLTKALAEVKRAPKDRLSRWDGW